jgi:hypothetical protein
MIKDNRVTIYYCILCNDLCNIEKLEVNPNGYLICPKYVKLNIKIEIFNKEVVTR